MFTIELRRYAVVAALCLCTGGRLFAQTHRDILTLSVGSGSSQSDINEAEALIGRMVREGTLVLEKQHPDDQLPGRHHEGYSQYHGGVAIYGGSVTRQVMDGEAVSIFGTVYRGVDVSTNPTLSLWDATTIVESSVSALSSQSAYRLVILPTVDGAYALTYLVTTLNRVTCFVDAHTGEILAEVDEKRHQGAIGAGRGVLGDTKKVSSTREGTQFVARDRLRPAELWTLATIESRAALERLVDGSLRPGDVASDDDNNWTDEGVVDTHAYMGWVYDYFFTRHGWEGVDDLNSTVYSARANNQLLPNNALYCPPPCGPSGSSGPGFFVFGTSSDGVPITALDIVGHEVMHGVTHFGVGRRNDGGLESFLHADGLGPTTLLIDGQMVPCQSVVRVFSDGSEFPFLCQDGRFVLVSDHGGTIHESFSDIFGTSVEFFFRGDLQTPADYLIGEDVQSFGPIRSLARPTDWTVDRTGNARFPDHYERRLRFAAIETAPNRAVIVPLVFDGVRFVDLARTNGGGVHWNSTILSHAYHLAIEGGVNSTSGVRVIGVGAARREKVEQVFFRAVANLLPGQVFLPQAADVVCQAAVDLFGHDNDVTRAVDQALHAVGLRPQPANRWCRSL